MGSTSGPPRWPTRSPVSRPWRRRGPQPQAWPTRVLTRWLCGRCRICTLAPAGIPGEPGRCRRHGRAGHPRRWHHLGQSRDDGVGDLRPRDRAGRVRLTGRSGRGRGQVALPRARPGNPAPRVHEVGAGMLNSVGLQGPGLAAWVSSDLPSLRNAGARTVVSIWGRTVSDYGRAVETVAAAAATDAGACIAALEVNVSCPNIEDRSRMFAHSADATARVLGATAWSAPVGQAQPQRARHRRDRLGSSGRRSRWCDPGQHVARSRARSRTGEPVLGAGGGGLSGGAAHPVAVRAVWECRAAFPELPIVGVGGVATGRDALELLWAGADAVQVGTATFRDPPGAVEGLAPAGAMVRIPRHNGAVAARRGAPSGRHRQRDRAGGRTSGDAE